jgi:cyclohexanone monooxygenase
MTTAPLRRFDAVIVGAGFSGLYMTKRLLDLGLTVRTYEAGEGVGGTWYWNRYPGARVDLESFDYSYSFSPELEREWDWSERYAAQPELLRYLNHVADRFGLRPHIQLNTRVDAAHYDELRNIWLITTADGQKVQAQFFITAAGVLSTPKPPELPGLDDFRGKWYHTGQWPRDGVEFSGLRVGVIGTGSSGIQIIPVIAQQAAHLTVFQRTPVYCVPIINHPLDKHTQEEVKSTYRARREKSRHSRYGIPADFPTTKTFDVSEAERRKIFERAWGEKGHLLAFRMTFADILSDEKANEAVSDFLRQKIREIVKDPGMAEALTPRSFPFGTKRPCLGTAYYSTFNRDNVSLVDLRKTPIVRVTPTGIQTSEGHHEFDLIVFATGFDALTGALLRIDIRGRDGRRLQEKWVEGPRAYLGLATNGFPNLFFITGPGSPGPLSNMAVSIEQHVEWVGDCIAYMRDNDIVRMEANEEAEDAWVAHVQDVVSGTLYQKANSWYLGANVPGKPRVFIPYLGGAGVYRKKCDEVAAAGYQGFTPAKSSSAAAQPESRMHVQS